MVWWLLWDKQDQTINFQANHQPVAPKNQLTQTWSCHLICQEACSICGHTSGHGRSKALIQPFYSLWGQDLSKCINGTWVLGIFVIIYLNHLPELHSWDFCHLFPNIEAFPGTSRAIVGTNPLKRPFTLPSDLRTCLATSIGPPYFTAMPAEAESANALWACNLFFSSTSKAVSR